MNDNNTIVERIDECLKNRNLKRLVLCEAVGITPTAITHWKTHKSMPAADTAVKIAQFLDVSVEWLINGTLPDPTEHSSPQAVATRIDNALTFVTGRHSYSDEDAWFDPIQSLVSIHTFYNWLSGRKYPDIPTVQKIADTLSLQTIFLLTGKNDTEYDSFTCNLADKYEFVIKGFHCLNDENQKIIDSLIAHLLKLQ